MKSALHITKVSGIRHRVPDFGTYHHSTPSGSESVRTKIKAIFLQAFDTLPFDRNDRLLILDIGCGLGFLSSVCAEYYPRALITGIDTFADPSLKDSSLSKAKENMEILGFSDRITFEEADILNSDYRRRRFDLFVSNLVFHNLGGRRFEAYRKGASWMSKNAVWLLGDLFFKPQADLRSLSAIFSVVKEIKLANGFNDYSFFMLSKVR